MLSILNQKNFTKVSSVATNLTFLSSIYLAIPDNQRDYEWKEKEITILLDSLGNNTYPYHLGEIALKKPVKKLSTRMSVQDLSLKCEPLFFIVDGQQRLVTLMLCLLAVYNKIQTDNSVNAKDKKSLCKCIDDVLIGKLQNSSCYPRLILKKNQGKYFNDLIMMKKIVSTNDDLEKHIAYCYKKSFEFITEQCKKLPKNVKNEELYRNLIDLICNQLSITVTILPDKTDIFDAFNGINSGKKELGPEMLIKNHYLQHFGSSTKSGITDWEKIEKNVSRNNMVNFFISFLFSEEGDVFEKKELSEEFKSIIINNKNITIDYLFSCSIIFGRLMKANTKDEALNDLLCGFNMLKVTQCYNLLFAIAWKFFRSDMLKDIYSADYRSFANTLQNLIVRMKVCSERTNKLTPLFKKCMQKTNLQDVIDLLNDEVQKRSDEMFKIAFKKFSPKNNMVSLYFMVCIENYLRGGCNRRLLSISKLSKNITLEHIIPQKVQKGQWYKPKMPPIMSDDDFEKSVVENIGNKALLRNTTNSAAKSCTEYIKKIFEYQSHSNNPAFNEFIMIKELVGDYNKEFTDIEVFDRAEKLADLAIKIW